MEKTFFKLFEIVSNGTSREYSLPTGDMLKQNNIVGIEAYNAGSFATIGTNGNTIAQVADCYLKLIGNDGQILVDALPLKRLDPVTNNGQIFTLNINAINPSDCQILVRGAAVPAAGQVFQIGFYFTKKTC